MEFSLQAALCRNPIAEVGSSVFKLPLLLCRLKPELHAPPWCIKAVGFGVQPLLVCRLSSQRPSRIHLGKYSAVLIKSSTGNC